MTPLALAAALVLAQPQAGWQAEVRVGARARSPNANDRGGQMAADVELAPRLGGSARSAGYSLSLGYLGTFRAREPHVSFRPDHHHLATLQAEWRREGRVRPFLFSTVSYGIVDLTNLAAPQPAPPQIEVPAADPGAADPNAPPPPAQPSPAPQNPQLPLDPVPQLSTLLAYGVDTTFGFEVPLAPTLGATFAAGFFHGGGADPASQASMPVQNTPRASARLDWQVTRLDGVFASADARYAWFSNLARAGTAELGAGWRRRLTETTLLELRLGAAGAVNNEPSATPPLSMSLMPTGGVTLNQRFPFRAWSLGLWASALATPFLDRFATRAYQRFEGSGGLNVAIGEWVAIRGGGGASFAPGGARPLNPEDRAGLLTTTWLDASVSVTPQPWWRVDLFAARSVVSSDLPAAACVLPELGGCPPGPPVAQWVIGLNLSVHGRGNL